jgi:hypothetical protein
VTTSLSCPHCGTAPCTTGTDVCYAARSEGEPTPVALVALRAAFRQHWPMGDRCRCGHWTAGSWSAIGGMGEHLADVAVKALTDEDVLEEGTF